MSVMVTVILSLIALTAWVCLNVLAGLYTSYNHTDEAYKGKLKLVIRGVIFILVMCIAGLYAANYAP